ncbi:MAG: helix-turn-helix domain-containing protein [Candidatus Competibacteraceae bacterium]|nr:helix-turn-helix domain-containing protein [Candidatus Competibacteraceae bacterium]
MARRVAPAHVLLQAATGATDAEIAVTLHLGIASVHRIRQRFVDEGANGGVKRTAAHRVATGIDGQTSGLSGRFACGTPPAGRHRWTLKLVADRFVELRQIDMISPDTVGRVLKTTSNRGSVKKGVFPA